MQILEVTIFQLPASVFLTTKYSLEEKLIYL